MKKKKIILKENQVFIHKFGIFIIKYINSAYLPYIGIYECISTIFNLKKSYVLFETMKKFKPLTNVFSKIL